MARRGPGGRDRPLLPRRRVLRVDRGSPDHFVQCLIGEASVGMNRISVPSKLFEEAVVILSMDVRSVRSGTIDSLHLTSPLLVMCVGHPGPRGSTSLCLRFVHVYRVVHRFGTGSAPVAVCRAVTTQRTSGQGEARPQRATLDCRDRSRPDTMAKSCTAVSCRCDVSCPQGSRAVEGGRVSRPAATDRGAAGPPESSPDGRTTNPR